MHPGLEEKLFRVNLRKIKSRGLKEGGGETERANSISLWQRNPQVR